MKHRPLIGIAPDIMTKRNGREILASYRAYIDSVETAGGSCIILSPHQTSIQKYLQSVDGLLLTGGDDIHPKYFGKSLAQTRLKLSHDDRTQFEIGITKAFIQSNLPVLGVCLGCQTLNIALGGTLFQNLKSEHPKAMNHRNGNHSVHIDSGTRLEKILKTNQIHVNSRHHQAVNRLGKSLVVSARAQDGVAEAIESFHHDFVLGVQWHPEELPKRKESKTLFRTFVQACKNGR